MLYINIKKENGKVKTIRSCETKSQARFIIKKYREDNSNLSIWISGRSTNEWRLKHNL